MKTAMILAAGRGERLRPLTDNWPKPLCRINNIPLIEYHIEKLAKVGFERLVINHAWLGSKIRQQLGHGSRWNLEICYAPEPPGGLETGGGIVNALPLLGNQPFLTVNADIFTDYDFKQPLSLAQDCLGHLVLVNTPRYLPKGDFDLLPTNRVGNAPRYTFSGIAWYNPQLFCDLQPGRYSITPLLRKMVDQGKICGSLYQGKWNDIGTLERLNSIW